MKIHYLIILIFIKNNYGNEYLKNIIKSQKKYYSTIELSIPTIAIIAFLYVIKKKLKNTLENKDNNFSNKKNNFPLKNIILTSLIGTILNVSFITFIFIKYKHSQDVKNINTITITSSQICLNIIKNLIFAIQKKTINEENIRKEEKKKLEEEKKKLEEEKKKLEEEKKKLEESKMKEAILEEAINNSFNDIINGIMDHFKDNKKNTFNYTKAILIELNEMFEKTLEKTLKKNELKQEFKDILKKIIDEKELYKEKFKKLIQYYYKMSDQDYKNALYYINNNNNSEETTLPYILLKIHINKKKAPEDKLIEYLNESLNTQLRFESEMNKSKLQDINKNTSESKMNTSIILKIIDVFIFENIILSFLLFKISPQKTLYVPWKHFLNFLTKGLFYSDL